MTQPGDLTKLLQQGYLNTEYKYQGKDGVFTFKLKTLIPLVETEIDKDVNARFASAELTDENARSIFLAIETLIRSVETVNGIPLENVPGAVGDTVIEKRRFLLDRFSQELLLSVWRGYQDLKQKTFPEEEDKSEGDSEIKK